MLLMINKHILLHQQHPLHVSWYFHERAVKTDTEENKLLNKVIIFVFFAYREYSCSFIKLRLNQWTVVMMLLSMESRKAHQNILICVQKDE